MVGGPGLLVQDLVCAVGDLVRSNLPGADVLGQLVGHTDGQQALPANLD